MCGVNYKTFFFLNSKQSLPKRENYAKVKHQSSREELAIVIFIIIKFLNREIENKIFSSNKV